MIPNILQSIGITTRIVGYGLVILFVGMGLVSLPWHLFSIWYNKPKRMDQFELRTLQRKLETGTMVQLKQAKALKEKKFEIDFNSTFITKRFKSIGYNKNFGQFL